MRERLISDIRGIFENMGIRVVEGYENLKADEIRYRFIDRNLLQLNYQGCNYDMVDEVMRGIEFLNNKIEDFRCTFAEEDIVWISF